MLWEVKVSKLCNLRCAYCYEYPHLDDAARMPIEGWRQILESARWYHETLQRDNPNEKVVTQIVWHGGEPLLLPVSYYEKVLALQREVFGVEALAARHYTNHVPTNLYSAPAPLIELLRREGFQIAVSFDVVPGVRVTAGGRPSEERVRANIARLLTDGWRLGINVVLGGHSATRLPGIYDDLKQMARSSNGTIYHMNVIGLHGTPTDNGGQAWSLPAEGIVGALAGMFDLWMTDPEPMPLHPLLGIYQNILDKREGRERAFFDRRRYGESCLIVNTDGYLYLFNDMYERDRALGCLFERPFSEIMRSPEYEASLAHDEAVAARICGGCPYDGYCNHQPLFTGLRDQPGPRCAIGYALHQRVEDSLTTNPKWRGEHGEAIPHGAL